MVDFMSMKFVVRESDGSGTTMCGAWNQKHVILFDEIMLSSIVNCYVQLKILEFREYLQTDFMTLFADV